MKEHRRYTLAISALAAMMVLAGTWIALVRQDQQPLSFPIERVFRYSFTVENTTGKGVSNANFWTYAPVAQTATQKSIAIESSTPHRIETDSLGNRRLLFDVPELPPYGSHVISVKAVVHFSRFPHPGNEPELNRFLRAEPGFESENKEIIAAATKLAAVNNTDTIASMYEWVIDNMRDSGYIAEDRGALYALREKTGDCTEYAYLFTALARANRIPARSVAGYVYPESAVLRPDDYHNWAEAHDDGRWWIVDPHKERFKEQFPNYVAMRIISDTQSGREGTSQRFFGTTSDLLVVMN